MKKIDWVWGISSFACLAASFVLCRFVFFAVHGMGAWPLYLAIAALVVLLVSALRRKRAVTVITVIGYAGGFVLGAIFQSDSVDPGGGRTNNLWIIWTVAFLICMVIGFAADLVFFKKAR